jgi:hypothetical protein
VLVGRGRVGIEREYVVSGEGLVRAVLSIWHHTRTRSGDENDLHGTLLEIQFIIWHRYESEIYSTETKYVFS